MIFLWLALVAGAITALIIRHKDLVAASYYSGYRAACKEAVAMMKLEEEKAMEEAPAGEMCVGVIRAQAIHDAKMIVRDLTYRIGRPL